MRLNADFFTSSGPRLSLASAKFCKARKKNELIAQYICIIMVYLKQQIMSFRIISARTEQLSETFH